MKRVIKEAHEGIVAAPRESTAGESKRVRGSLRRSLWTWEDRCRTREDRCRTRRDRYRTRGDRCRTWEDQCNTRGDHCKSWGIGLHSSALFYTAFCTFLHTVFWTSLPERIFRIWTNLAPFQQERKWSGTRWIEVGLFTELSREFLGWTHRAFKFDGQIFQANHRL